MSDLEQRVDIVQVDLPELKRLDGRRMQRRDADGCLSKAKEVVIIILVMVVPGLSRGRVRLSIARGVFPAVGVAKLSSRVLVKGRSWKKPNRPSLLLYSWYPRNPFNMKHG